MYVNEIIFQRRQQYLDEIAALKKDVSTAMGTSAATGLYKMLKRLSRFWSAIPAGKRRPV